MGYIAVEEVTLPTRFLLKTGHFITFLALAFNIDNVITNMTQLDPTTISGSNSAYYDDTRRVVQGLTYAAFACFALEYITLFLGATTFLRGVNSLNILAHGVGLVLMILFQVDNWSKQALIAFFTVFNASPAFIELACLLFTSNSIFIGY